MCRGLDCVVLRVSLALAMIAAAARLMAQQKAPVPETSAQEEARTVAREVYGDQFLQAKTGAAKAALAKEMIEAALRVRDGSAEQYVLLEIARDVAAGAGDAPTALAAVQKLAERFDVPAAKLKAEALLSVSRQATLTSQHEAIALAGLGLIRQLTEADDYETAIRLCEVTTSGARRARRYALARELTAQEQDLRKRQADFQQYCAALAVLEKAPTDPAANLAAGRYLCFVKLDWERGVSMLALGNDAELKALALEDLKGANSTDDRVARGDAWWSLAETKEGREREALMLRAGCWYRQAKPGLAGTLLEVKVERRLEEITELWSKIAGSSTGPPLAIVPFDEKKAKALQAAWARLLGVPVVQTNSIGMKLVLIPPGEFEMGSSDEEIARLLREAEQAKLPGWYRDRVPPEGPRHRVRITRPFYLGVYEVTQAEYARVTGKNPSRFKRDPNRPVEMMSWQEAQEFCRRLSEVPKEKAAGAVYGLPTEAEWEYACRAGSTTRWCFGDDEAAFGDYAWYVGDSGKRTHPVGQKRPNAWGLYDMHGNVWEWCADWYERGYYKTSPAEDPTGPSSGSDRVLRGGSWLYIPGVIRSAGRNRLNPDGRTHDLGFRVASTP